MNVTDFKFICVRCLDGVCVSYNTEEDGGERQRKRDRQTEYEAEKGEMLYCVSFYSRSQNAREQSVRKKPVPVDNKEIQKNSH